MDLHAAYVQLLLILFPIPLLVWIDRYTARKKQER